jgi:O-acetylhomoserine/O-acetylserine sulfhydrylase
MQLKTLLLTTLLTLGLHLPSTLASTSTPIHDKATKQTTKITLRLPPAAQNPALPNPHLLPASTHATLTTAGRALSAPLSTANTFVFPDVAPGSYLVDVHCATHGFVPYRLDVTFPRRTGEEKKGEKEGLEVSVWETFRGNDWGNKGEGVPVGVGAGGGEVEVEVRVKGGKGYFMERSGCEFFFCLCLPGIGWDGGGD